MALETTDSLKPMRPIDRKTSLADINPQVWFLGCGVGCTTGLALLYAFLSIWKGNAPWLAIPALLIALIHGAVITLFWLYRNVVHRRTALMVSMIASSILTSGLAMICSNGMPTSPLYGLALMQLVTAFCHPFNFDANLEAEK